MLKKSQFFSRNERNLLKNKEYQFSSEHHISASERRVLALLLREGKLTQSAISEQTGLAQQSISRLLNELVRRGCIVEAGRVSLGQRGQAPAAFRLSGKFATSIGVAIMADTISVALLDFAGNVTGESVEILPDMRHATVLSAMQVLMDDLMDRHKVDRERIVGMGAGVSGFFTSNTAALNTPASLDDWALVDIAELLSEHFGVPAWMDNDGNAAALGEGMIGVGRWARKFAYLYFATGFGGGVIIDGKLMRGSHGNAGEFAGILPAAFPHPNLESLRNELQRHGIQTESVAAMVAGFDPAWPGVDEWIDGMMPSLDLVTSAIHAVIDPDAIVLGGRMPAALAELLIPRITLFATHRRGSPPPLPIVVLAEARGDATAIGAALLPFKKCFFD